MWITGCRLNAGIVEIGNHIETGGHRRLGSNANQRQSDYRACNFLSLGMLHFALWD
jgi:hypothetical protein